MISLSESLSARGSVGCYSMKWTEWVTDGAGVTLKCFPQWKISPKRDNRGIDYVSPLLKYRRLHKKPPHCMIASSEKSLPTGKNPSCLGDHQAGRIFAGKLSAGRFFSGRSYNVTLANSCRFSVTRRSESHVNVFTWPHGLSALHVPGQRNDPSQTWIRCSSLPLYARSTGLTCAICGLTANVCTHDGKHFVDVLDATWCTRSPAVAKITDCTGCQWPSRSSKVDDVRFIWKGVWYFLLVINSNFGCISRRFQIWPVFRWKTHIFLPPPVHSTPNLKMFPLH